MHPAWSVIFFTVLAGMGQGLFLMLVRAEAHSAEPLALAIGGLLVWTPSRNCRDSAEVNVQFPGLTFSSNQRL